MKRILITGANSYIGTSFEKYVLENYKDYIVNTMDMRKVNWKDNSFQGYDVIFHVAGIAHSDNGKISKEREELYYKVNTELTIETAKKAKVEGVKQFVFMSSAIVYGNSAPIGKSKVITRDTPVAPENCYGDSKVQAEKNILALNDKDFKVVVLRAPMIYGEGCKGNYLLLSKIAKKMTIFPYVENQRSMLYIGNLCEFVYMMIKNEESGMFWPQNNEYSNTSEIVREIGKVKGKKVLLIPGFVWMLKLFGKVIPTINKAFGNLYYDKKISQYKEQYCKYSLIESIKVTEKNE